MLKLPESRNKIIKQGTKAGLQLLKVDGDKDGINDYITLKISDTGEDLWKKSVGSKGGRYFKKTHRDQRWWLFAGRDFQF